MNLKDQLNVLQVILERPPEAYAVIKGSTFYPDITGKAEFYPLWGGTIVIAAVANLPFSEQDCSNRFHGFHIHEGNSCEGTVTPDAAFPLTGNHYNPKKCSHPEHHGDLPPLMENHGFALQVFFTDQFVPEEIVGRTLIIHSMPDDFTSQPSGNSGTKIACGEILMNNV